MEDGPSTSLREDVLFSVEGRAACSAGSSGLASHLEVVYMALVYGIGTLEGFIGRDLLA